jgi:hypothetical protein
VKKSRKLFILSAAVFLCLLVYASYDISKRTTFPGSKAQLPERLKNAKIQQDSAVRKE